MPLHIRIGEEIRLQPAHAFHIAKADFVAFVVIIQKPLIHHFGVAQPESIVEGLPRHPFRWPIMAKAQEFENRRLQPGGPAFHIVFRAAFDLKFHVEHSQHQEQGDILALSRLWRGAMGAINPVAHHGGHRAHFLIAVLQAEQHGSQFLFRQIALIKVSDLAAPQQHEKIVLRHFLGLGGIVFLTPTRAGKIQQIGIVEEVEGLVFQLQLQFGDHRRQHRARQFCPAPSTRCHRHRVTIAPAQMRHGLNINDALRLGLHRQYGAAGFLRKIELRQSLNQF